MGAIPPSGQVCSGSCHLLLVQALALSVLTLCDHLEVAAAGEFEFAKLYIFICSGAASYLKMCCLHNFHRNHRIFDTL